MIKARRSYRRSPMSQEKFYSTSENFLKTKESFSSPENRPTTVGDPMLEGHKRVTNNYRNYLVSPKVFYNLKD